MKLTPGMLKKIIKEEIEMAKLRRIIKEEMHAAMDEAEDTDPRVKAGKEKAFAILNKKAGGKLKQQDKDVQQFMTDNGAMAGSGKEDRVAMAADAFLKKKK